MNRFDILARLESHKDSIAECGVETLQLFGSWARDEARDDSDVDVLVSFREKSYQNYFRLKELLEQVLERRVDLVTTEALKPALREAILEEAVDASIN